MQQIPRSIAASFLLLLGCAGAADPSDAAGVETLPGGGSGGDAGSLSTGGTAAGGSIPSQGGSTLAEIGGSAGSAGVAAVGGADMGGTSSSNGGGSGSGNGGSSSSAGTDSGEMLPPGPIDYRMWALQLPIGNGSPTTIKPAELLAGFKNEYFYPADDGGQMFMDPVTGVTTSGSTRCRTEMREADPDGGQAAWSASAVNRMTVEGKIVKGGGATITIGQILNGTDSFPLAEFEWSSGKNGFQLFYEEAKGNGQTIPLNTPWQENERYSFTLELSNNKLLISVNGKQVYSRTPGANMLTKKFYFKFGNYDQNTSSGPASTTPHSIVEAYKVDVVHE